MSQSDNESNIVNSFRELLNYVGFLGEHINQIYDHLEKIETDIDKTKEELGASIADNRKELEIIKKSMITKTEFNDTLQKLNQPFEKFMPPKTTERTRKPRSTTSAEQEKKKPKPTE
jgi:hypothetical protein